MVAHRVQPGQALAPHGGAHRPHHPPLHPHFPDLLPLSQISWFSDSLSRRLHFFPVLAPCFPCPPAPCLLPAPRPCPLPASCLLVTVTPAPWAAARSPIGRAAHVTSCPGRGLLLAAGSRCVRWEGWMEVHLPLTMPLTPSPNIQLLKISSKSC